ncbi:hypothetical protein AC783_02035 [Helicobacter pylori]|nr:hypothetical protein N205_08390 [Helicobacter pylori UM077]KMZ47688.1 hypothetical protein AC783_02035 [Helicobacter pylori]
MRAHGKTCKNSMLLKTCKKTTRMTRYISWDFSFEDFVLCARFVLSCLILLTQNHLRLTPTISNCDALLSMLAYASLICVCLSANQ